MATLEAAA
ncbi:MAG: hypothetical protein KJ007_07840, partial [Burkholderiales bacterium]|nr:hypothetical protein [Burkholderiales bacterium]